VLKVQIGEDLLAGWWGIVEVQVMLELDLFALGDSILL
jgi:hypothetical protein